MKINLINGWYIEINHIPWRLLIIGCLALGSIGMGALSLLVLFGYIGPLTDQTIHGSILMTESIVFGIMAIMATQGYKP